MRLDEELHTRLVNWSKWETAFANKEVGYPSESSTAKLAELGIGHAMVRQSKPPFPLNNLQADEMNGWLNIMGKINPPHKEAIRVYYLRKDGETTESLARKNGLSRSSFNQTLREARLWLQGRLSFDYENKC